MWHLKKIPQIAHFYWGSDTISFLRYLTIFTFRKFNPDWQIKLYYPRMEYQGRKTWDTLERYEKFTGKNYTDKLSDLNIEKIEVDFYDLGIEENIPEPFKADFLRWHLISTIGGLWSDMDIIYFKPMESLYFNNELNENVDTILCLNEERTDFFKHSIGFLMSSPNNDFYKFIRKESFLNLNTREYQSVGSAILNSHFPTISKIKNDFKNNAPYNFKMATVYPLNDVCIPSIFDSNDLSCITEFTIGMHWYAGHPEAGQWETALTKNNFPEYDNILCKVIGMALKEKSTGVSSGCPKVTVLMAVYNGEQYLKDSIESILNQTFTDFEFLIINDGSTDNSEDVIKAYGDPRIRLVNIKKNIGLGLSLNRGIDLSRGEYIARMDCDDISLPDRLNRQVAFMEEHPDYGLCAANMLLFYDDGSKGPGLWNETPVPIEWTLLWENPIAHPTVMLRKSVLLDTGLRYRDVPAQDLDLWTRLVLKTKFIRLPEILLHYRFRPDSNFNANKNSMLIQSIKSNSELVCVIAGEKAPEFYRELTIYPGAMGEPPKYHNVAAVNKWLEALLEKCREIFKWDSSSYRYAKEDCQRLLAKIPDNN